jgi:hypothetical protein
MTRKPLPIGLIGYRTSAVRICQNAWVTASMTFLVESPFSAPASMALKTLKQISVEGTSFYPVNSIISGAALTVSLMICSPSATRPKDTRVPQMHRILTGLLRGSSD